MFSWIRDLWRSVLALWAKLWNPLSCSPQLLAKKKRKVQSRTIIKKACNRKIKICDGKKIKNEILPHLFLYDVRESNVFSLSVHWGRGSGRAERYPGLFIPVPSLPLVPVPFWGSGEGVAQSGPRTEYPSQTITRTWEGVPPFPSP